MKIYPKTDPLGQGPWPSNYSICSCNTSKTMCKACTASTGTCTFSVYIDLMHKCTAHTPLNGLSLYVHWASVIHLTICKHKHKHMHVHMYSMYVNLLHKCTACALICCTHVQHVLPDRALTHSWCARRHLGASRALYAKPPRADSNNLFSGLFDTFFN